MGTGTLETEGNGEKMASFLYYVPSLTKKVIKSLDDLGDKRDSLAKVLGDAVSFPCVPVSGGPDKLNGLMFSVMPEPGGTEPQCGYYPDQQTWNEVQNEQGETLYWLGMETDNPPKPEDVIRKKTIGGHPVELEDGNIWSIPAVHARMTTIPNRFVVGPKGDVSLVSIGGYDELMADAEGWFDVVKEGKEYFVEDLFEYATKLLNVNYRMGMHEVSMARLLTDRKDVNELKIIGASIGLPDLKAETESVKKKSSILSDGSEVSPGEEGLIPATSQPTAT